jgi:hypothetical protein
MPASRFIAKPLLLFFSNFDDLQLYNYIQTTFSPVMENVFGQIEQIERDKWEFVSFVTIWQQWLGIDIHKVQNYFNSTHRQAYSSSRFKALQGKANGYVLNTLQFYLSNFILALIIFGIGNLLFKLLKARKYSVKSLFVGFRFWLAFPIVLFEGNIQYMTYLMGFEL